MSKKERFLKLKLLHMLMNLQELLALPPKKRDLKKIKVKVSGFVVVKKAKIGDTSENSNSESRTEKIVAKVRNQVTGISSLIYGLAGDKAQVQVSDYPPGVVLYNSAGQVITNLALQNVNSTPQSTGATLIFQVYDNSANSYTATQLQLITEAGGTATAVATTTLTLTKEADEVLYINWFLVFTVASNSSSVVVAPSLSAGIDFNNCTNGSGGASPCGVSITTGQITSTFPSCATGSGAQYLGQNFVTSLLFSLLGYSTSSISFAYPGSNTLGIAVLVGGYSDVSVCGGANDTLGEEIILAIGESSYFAYQNYTCTDNSNSLAFENNNGNLTVNHVLAGIRGTLQGTSCGYMGVVIEFAT